MKIEKISENQIRCTLSNQDLAERELKISELAYGTDKAKALFRDMMQQASFEFGFEAEDIPLMIEAIPISRETLILVITKVEDPDELDTRFSKFSPENQNEDGDELFYQDDDLRDFASELLSRYDQITGALAEPGEDALDEAFEMLPAENVSKDDSNEDFVPLSESLGYNKSETKTEDKAPADIVKIYSFISLDNVTRFAVNIANDYDGLNSIYKCPDTSKYYLVLHKSEHAPEVFNRICNIASEYGSVERTTYATAYHFNEHFELIIKNKAIQVLASL